MNNPIEKIFRPAKQVRLEKEKKDSIREGILMFMKANPLSSAKTTRAGFWSIIFSPRLKPAYITVASLALVLFIAGTISVQADSALPGDLLYPVKVGINEKVLQVLAFSDQAKIKLGVQLADVRLQEAEKLAVEGKITPKNQAIIDNNFNAQANAVTQSINKLNSEKMYSNAQKVASDFEASLKAHSQVLETIKNKNNKVQDNINSLINNVNSEVIKTSDSSVISVNNALNAPGAKVSAKERIAQNRLQTAQKSIDEVKNLIESQKDKIGADAVSQIQDNLNLAEQNITDGTNKISGDNPDFAGAILLFDQANVIAKQSKNLIQAKNNLKININLKINSNNNQDNQINNNNAINQGNNAHNSDKIKQKVNEQIQNINNKVRSRIKNNFR